MIPNEVFELLSQPMAGHLGTRDKKLTTTETFIWGLKINDDKQTVTVFIPEKGSTKQISNLTDNKQTSLFINHVISYVSFQLKGEYLSHHIANANEEDLIDKYIANFYEYLSKHGYPREIVDQFAIKPAVAITFKVTEVFTQTPGPGAGTKIS